MSEIQPGIYLEVKKGALGTGATAKEMTYRNFWLTLEFTSDHVLCMLLDHDFKPTRIREQLPRTHFTDGKLVYIPQGEKKYQLILKRIAAEKSAEAAKAAEAAAPAKQAPKWWESQEKDVNPGDLFKRDEKKPEQPAPAKSNAWWEPENKIEPGSLFDRPEKAPPKKDAKPKPKKNETRVKKSWWDK